MASESAKKCVTFVTMAEFWRGNDDPEMRDITVVRSESGELTVDGQPAEMAFNGIQLRFEIGEDWYVVFDKFVDHSKPPKPIAEMHDALK